MDADGNTVGGGAMNEREIGERIALIESMMRSGRKIDGVLGMEFSAVGRRLCCGGGVVEPVAACRRFGCGVAGDDDLRVAVDSDDRAAAGTSPATYR